MDFLRATREDDFVLGFRTSVVELVIAVYLLAEESFLPSDMGNCLGGQVFCQTGGGMQPVFCLPHGRRIVYRSLMLPSSEGSSPPCS